MERLLEALRAYSPKCVEGVFCEVHARLLGCFLRALRAYRGRLLNGPSGMRQPRQPPANSSFAILLLLMGPNGETTRLPAGYTLDLLGDPCVIVLRRADGTVAARFTKHVDPEEIRRTAEEDHRRAAGGRQRDP